MEQFLAVAVAASHGAIVLLLFTLLYRWYAGKTPLDVWLDRLARYGVALAFFIALASVTGSLFYSEIIGFEPCLLCWYQRIFMFPLVLILGVAVWKERSDVWVYAMPLAIVGAVIAAYHVFLQVAPLAAPKLVDCTLGGVDCAVPYTQYFGYISIPVMSLTSFVLIGVLLWLSMRKN